MTNIENALVWLYAKTWGKFGDRFIAEDIWNFAANDLEMAIMGLAYPKKKVKSERVQALNDLIMGKFEEGGLAAFREWCGEIHNQVIESLPETVDPFDPETSSQQQRAPVKILNWDLGRYPRPRVISNF